MATLNAHIANSQILNSWKEIAVYLGRGLRTVQRWERELALPVRRPRGKSRSAVLALRKEIDEWIARKPETAAENTNGLAAVRRPTTAVTNLQASIQQSRQLWEEARQRRQELSIALQTLVNGLDRFAVPKTTAFPNEASPTDIKKES